MPTSVRIILAMRRESALSRLGYSEQSNRRDESRRREHATHQKARCNERTTAEADVPAVLDSRETLLSGHDEVQKGPDPATKGAPSLLHGLRFHRTLCSNWMGRG